MSQLRGQVAVITGAGSGVGRATALALAREGVALALAGRREEPLRETAALLRRELGGDAPDLLPVPCDISQPDAVRSLIAQAIARWDRVDILVNNAGVNTPRRALTELSWEDWQYLIRVNLDGCFLCAQAVLPHMRERGSGTLIHIGSVAARRVSAVSGAAYTAAKAGLTALSAAIDAEERARGIRSSVITLGLTNTPLMEKRPVPPSMAVRNRAIQPEDVAACVLLIASLPSRAVIEELVLTPIAGS